MGAITAREIALKVLIEYPGRAKPEDILDQYLASYELDRKDRALATHIVSGTIKWRRRLDHVIKQLSHRKRVVSPVALNALRLSLFQLIFLDKVPHYSATNEAVNLVKKYGDRFESGYVNAILRRYLREKEQIDFPPIEKDPVKHISTLYSYPPWLIRRWLDRYSIDETIRLAIANNRVAETGLRANILRAPLSEIRNVLLGDGAEIVSEGFAGLPHFYVKGISPIERARAYRDGLVQVQDGASALVSRMVNPEQGSSVVDLCSAPGGKVTHLYEIVGGKALVVANDISLRRLFMVRKNAARLGHDHMSYVVSDGRKPAFGRVDFLLIDAPCTGLGVLSRRWDLRWSKREVDVKRMAEFQKQMLLSAIDIARSGGVVVYSTCSIEPEENEEVVRAVCSMRKDVRLSDIRGLVPTEFVYGFGMMQTVPHVHGVDGMFAVRLVRI